MKIPVTLLLLIVSVGSAAEPSGLKDAYQKFFTIGAAIPSARMPAGELDLLKRNFSSITAENLMKPKYLQPAEGRFEFAKADEFLDFAKSNQLEVHGHTLVWHNQCPEWIFKDGDKTASRERVLERVAKHVSTVVGRYKGRIRSWDVVNEAIDDDKSGQDLRKSPWFLATGGDYIAEAFRAARRADPAAVLYYNDYDIEKPIKRDKTLRLIRSLKAQKVPLDGIGIQGHWRLDGIHLADIESAIIAFHSEGLRVSITELDLDVVTEKTGDPFAENFPPAYSLKQAEQYAGLFRLFHKHADKIDRVTFWGLHDGQSWLNYSPRKRTNHPLLWARDLSPKPAFQSVMNATAVDLLSLDNGTVKVGINRAKGAAITWLSWADYPQNAVNHADPGRLIQQSYYAGHRLDRSADGQSPSWSPWAWNPIQGGGVASWARVNVMERRPDGTLYGETVPKLWDMPDEEAAALMRQWTGIEPAMPEVVVVKSELICQREDGDRWGPAAPRPQEIPACYFTRNFSDARSYLGKGKWRAETQPPGPPWGHATPPLKAMAFFNKAGQGIAVFSPTSTINWNYGPHGVGASDDPAAGPCMHVAPLDRVNLGPKSTYSFRYWMVVGDEKRIASRLDALIAKYSGERASLSNEASR
jgi:GH35 family endo-1,4-beta-xylanase